MNCIKILIKTIGLSLFISACTTPQPQQPYVPEASQASTDSGNWRFFDGEKEQLANDIAQELMTSCHLKSMQKRDDLCIRAKIVSSFDTSGIGKKSCDSLVDVWKLAECITIGNAAESIRSSIRDSRFPSMTDQDWLNYHPYLDKLSTALEQQIKDDCHTTNLGNGDSCVRSHTSAIFDLATEVKDRCNGAMTYEDFTTCLAEGYALKIMRAALSRMTAKAA